MLGGIYHHRITSKIFSFGVIPFAALSNSEVIEQLDSGKRLPKPDSCPADFWNIIMRCWEHSPTNRPSFKTLNSIIELNIQNVESMIPNS